MKPGDSVSVVDEDLHGTVVKVLKHAVIFTDQYGFEHQYPASRLVIRDSELYSGAPAIQKDLTSKRNSAKKSNNRFVLDLHFEKLAPNATGYSSGERLQMQNSRLRDALDHCRKNHIKTLEIIHGIGDGTLQRMVTDFLEGQTGLEFHHNAVLKEESASVTVFLR